MNKKIIIAIIVILVLLIAGMFLFRFTTGNIVSSEEKGPVFTGKVIDNNFEDVTDSLVVDPVNPINRN